MNAPSLFPNVDVSLSSSQVTKLNALLHPCSTYSVGFGIFKSLNGDIQYIGTLCYSIDGKPATKYISRETFGEMVTEVFEVIQSLKL
jgi:hypothetical protein